MGWPRPVLGAPILVEDLRPVRGLDGGHSTSPSSLVDAEMVPEARVGGPCGALSQRPIRLENLSKGQARRANNLGAPTRPTYGAPDAVACLAIACSTPTGGSSNARPARSRSALRSSTCCCIWSRTVRAWSARTTCWRRSGAGGSSAKSTITSHINAARTAIGDNGQDQRFIRTVARKGFRFVGDVTEASQSGAGDTVAQRPAPRRFLCPTSRRSPSCRSST